MESWILLLGIAAFIGLLGGFISFFKMLGNGSEQAELKKHLEKIDRFEIELQQLKTQVERLSGQGIAGVDPVKDMQEAAPGEPEGEEFPDHVSDDALAQQALASAPLENMESVAAVSIALPLQAGRQAQQDWEDDDSQQTTASPNIVEKAFIAAKEWLFGGNTLVRSGIVILFIGISFLLKYAAEHTQVPIEFRMAGIALSGIGLLALGWHLRSRRPEYSWAIQGGGVGVLYLTIFAALKLYQLIPAGLAFFLLIAVAFLSALIAVLQSAMALAVLGFAGGFLAPILTSSGQGSHVGLFSYYLVLNLGIAFVAFHKSWRPLNVLGFAFTFIISTLWGAKSYTPALFASTEPFLVIHFLLFTLIAILYAHRQSTKAGDYVDATLVFGTPIVGFSLQYALLRDSHFGLAYSALALAIFYIALAWWLLTRRRDTLQFLGECFLALGIGFATLTLPLALDGRWTSAAWAIEGVGLVWVGLRQKRTFPLLAGLALQLLGAAAFANGWGITGYSDTGHQNMFLGVAFIALSGWACGALLVKYLPAKTGLLSTLLAIWGWLWWVGSGFVAIDAFLPASVYIHACLLFVAVTSLLLPYLARSLRWPRLGTLSALLLPAMVIALLLELMNTHPFNHYGWLAWGGAFAVQAWLLRNIMLPAGAWMRAPLLWLLAFIGALEWNFWITDFLKPDYSRIIDTDQYPSVETYWPSVWQDIGWAIVPLAILVLVTRWQKSRQHLHADETSFTNSRAWLWFGSAPIALFLVLWFITMSLYSSGDARPLPYIPLLNPLDIALAGALLALLIWKQAVIAYFMAGNLSKALEKIAVPLAGLMAFALLNGMLLRSLHYWAQTPFMWTAIFDYTLVQVSFTFLWGITALSLMLIAHRRAHRTLWIVGASLMGLVVLKLFLLDLAEHGSVERIISFIGAGILLLVMGYFAPLPPARKDDTPETEPVEPASEPIIEHQLADN